MSPYAAHHAPIDRAPNVHGNANPERSDMTTIARISGGIPAPPPRSTEVSVDQLETHAFTDGAVIDLPAWTGGWARVVTSDGTRFHAWLNGVAA